ncbi:unnamed protein product, partial [Protopolystoma xenopodis]
MQGPPRLMVLLRVLLRGVHENPQTPRWRSHPPFTHPCAGNVALFDPRSLYLSVYCIFQFSSYLFVLACLVYHALIASQRQESIGKDEGQSSFHRALDALVLAQLASCFDVGHALLGWVRSNSLMAFFQ